MVVLAGLFSNPSPSPLSRAIAAYRRLHLHGPPRLAAPSTASTAPSKRAIRLNPSQVARLVRSYQDGATVYDLANTFAIHRTTATNHLKQAGIRMRGLPPDEPTVDQMAQLYLSGLSLEKISLRTGYSAATVRTHIRSRGIATRDTHGRSRPTGGITQTIQNYESSTQPDRSVKSNSTLYRAGRS